MSSKLVQAVSDANVPDYISDNLVYKDRILSGIQVRALSEPAQFVIDWDHYIRDSVNIMYSGNPNLYDSFSAYADLLAVPDIDKRTLFASFVQKFIEEFNKHVIGEDVAGMAQRKLEKGHHKIQ